MLPFTPLTANANKTPTWLQNILYHPWSRVAVGCWENESAFWERVHSDARGQVTQRNCCRRRKGDIVSGWQSLTYARING